MCWITSIFIFSEHFPETFTVIFVETHLLLKCFNISALIFILNSMLSGPPREFLGPKAKGNVTPSSNSPNNDTQGVS
jgi:hypothetical protein